MQEPSGVAALILAAGTSSRFGSPKQLARVGERTMLDAVVELASAAGLQPIMAVVPPGIAVPPEAVPVLNDRPREGLSRSLRLGIEALPAETTAALILLGDQPTLPLDTIGAVLAARGELPIAAAQADGLLAPPVLVERSHFSVVRDLSGDIGLREVLAEHPDLVRAVEVGEHAIDVDTPDDLARIGQMFDSSAGTPNR
jgi:molybdenum cofactor cytidylyltransferase